METFEAKLMRLEEIVKQMEQGQLTLDASLKLFAEGTELTRACQGQLAQAEAQVQKLVGVDENGQPIVANLASDSHN